jgi:hypothetical protein
MRGNDWAIVVGIQDYPGLANKLQGVRGDAADFRTWLLKDARVPADHVLAEISPPKRAKTSDSARPPLAVIDRLFEEIVERVIALQGGSLAAETKLGRRLYIYLGGHGFEPDGAEPALLAADAVDASMKHVAGRLYAEYFRRAACFSEVVLIMDCCRIVTSSFPLAGVPFKRLINPGGAARWFYAYATLTANVAREGGKGANSRGLFTSAILAGLKGGAAINGRITDRSLKQFVEGQMRKKGIDPDEEQVPEIKLDDVGGLVLHEIDVVQYKVALSIPRKCVGGTYEVIGRQATQVASGNAAPEKLRLKLENGKYAVYLEGELATMVKIEGKDLALEVPEP